jgi:hypothetical protein
MARKIHGGVAGGSGLGGLSATETTLTAQEDADITLDPTGTGIVVLDGHTLLKNQSAMRFGDADSTNYVGFKAPATITSDFTWILPDQDATAANQSLVSDAAGTLSWVTTGAQITDDTSGSSAEYLIFGTATSGTLLQVSTSSSKLTYTPSTGEVNCDAMLVDGTVRALRTEVTQTTAYTLQLTDRDKVVNMNNGTDVQVIIPNDSTVNFPVGSVVHINRTGAGNVTLTKEAGVTTTKSGNMFANEELLVRKRAANNWIVVDHIPLTGASGGSESVAGGYKISQFNSNGTYSVE